MDWYAFDAVFPVDKDVLIRVSYIMSNNGNDALQSIEYTLETGAARKGPIADAYIIFRSPYLVTNENVLKETTPGYQTLHNEIYWHYKNLEPTHQNNIVISVISPDTWNDILSYNDRIKNNPHDIDAWISLAGTYTGIAFYHGNILRVPLYEQKAEDTYQQAFNLNPNSADLYADYADMYNEKYMCFVEESGCAKNVLTYLDHALRLDPSNKHANDLLNNLLESNPSLTYTPPPIFTPTDDFPPTVVFLLTNNPTLASDTITPTPGRHSYKAPNNSPYQAKSADTATPRPNNVLLTTNVPTAQPTETHPAYNLFIFPWAVTGIVAIFLLTLGIVVLINRRKG
jgi:tetratricopeptide (TPR) repeat protein